VAVLYRVEVGIIEMPREIVLVAQRMLPIPPLPNPALAFWRRGWRRSVQLGANYAKNRLSVRRQRVAKSASPSGRVQIACK
jgi:hypothetical protein